ncbi:MAG: hypothetical protein Q8P54_01525, partial [bacterium]|nr:hypothetical protein [bacterium]
MEEKMSDVENKIKKELINTGIFLEGYTYKLFSQWNNAKFTTYREFPFHNKSGDFEIEGLIDVLALRGVERGLAGDNIELVLPIECKRADPVIKHWVFESFPPQTDKNKQYFLISDGNKISYTNDYDFPKLGYSSVSDYENAINVFEFNQET